MPTEPVKRKLAVDSRGETVNLPARPERADFKTLGAFQEALSGWNHRILPLLSLPARSMDARE